MVSCTTCAEDDQRNFSKRMLAGAWARKGAPVRCKACVSRAEEAERAAASAKASAAAASAAAASTARERCSGCSKLLEAAAFSRSQLLQKGDAKRCRACVSAAGADGGSSLLSEAAAGVPRGANLSALLALPEPQPVIELSRLKKLKRLRRALPRLCAAEAGASPPILAFDRWLARCRLSEPEGTGDPLLPSSGHSSGAGSPRDQQRPPVRVSIAVPTGRDPRLALLHNSGSCSGSVEPTVSLQSTSLRSKRDSLGRSLAPSERVLERRVSEGRMRSRSASRESSGGSGRMTLDAILDDDGEDDGGGGGGSGGDAGELVKDHSCGVDRMMERLQHKSAGELIASMMRYVADPHTPRPGPHGRHRQQLLTVCGRVRASFPPARPQS